MHPTEVLERLVVIQKNDGALDSLARERQAGVDELDLLQAKVKAVEDQMALEKKGQEVLAKARKTVEIEVGAKETQISKYQNQLLEVKSNDQYQALQHEIEKTKSDKAKLEEQILEAMFKDDEMKKRLQALAHQADEDKKRLAEERKVIEAKIAELDRAAVEKRKERDEVLAKAREEMGPDVESYEAIRKSGKKVAVARIQDENCEGCHMSVSPQTLQEVRRGIQLVRCTCGRFLYYEEEA
jgi:hypothetical protein